MAKPRRNRLGVPCAIERGRFGIATCRSRGMLEIPLGGGRGRRNHTLLSTVHESAISCGNRPCVTARRRAPPPRRQRRGAMGDSKRHLTLLYLQVVRRLTYSTAPPPWFPPFDWPSRIRKRLKSLPASSKGLNLKTWLGRPEVRRKTPDIEREVGTKALPRSSGNGETPTIPGLFRGQGSWRAFQLMKVG